MRIAGFRKEKTLGMQAPESGEDSFSSMLILRETCDEVGTLPVSAVIS